MVTPCMGVWIETMWKGEKEDPGVSHPVWVCGLKHGLNIDRLPTVISHTLYGCVD